MEESYENFKWEKYIEKYLDLSHIITKDEAWSHWNNYGKNENREYFFSHDNNSYSLPYDNDNNHLIELKQDFNHVLHLKKNFDWIKYIDDYKDLSCFLDKEQAWHHWILHGRREKRVLEINNNPIINNTQIHNGRFGNLFFVNMVLHFISKKYNLKTTYKYYEKFLNVGIDLFIGKNTYKENVYLTEINYFDLMFKKNNFTNVIVTNNTWFQNYEFCLYLEIYFNTPDIKKKIINKNKFCYRYKSNNDLFVHVRLDDVEEMSSHNDFDYYDTIIKKYTFENGYISSDNLNSTICNNLIQKYSLKAIHLSEEETIMFGSTCNTIILSGGTFSWLIGFLAFYSTNINYPINIKKWYGDIFVYKNWIGN
jgi:hypothetical protein